MGKPDWQDISQLALPGLAEGLGAHGFFELTSFDGFHSLYSIMFTIYGQKKRRHSEGGDTANV